MTTYTYSGDPDRYYPELALTVNPGDTAVLEANPGDGLWTPLDTNQLPPPPTTPDIPTTPVDPATAGTTPEA